MTFTERPRRENSLKRVREFPHVTRACEGVVLKSGDVVKSLMERAQTRTGLCVTVDIQPQTCEACRL